MKPPVSEKLRLAAAPIWEKCLAHPFVSGIADGSLPIEKFRYYMLQDYLYLIDYARVFAVGIAKAQDYTLMRRFAKNVDVILDGEMNIHRAYMKRLGISEEEVLSARPALDNKSYTQYMLAAAYTGGTAEIVAAILACSWSYAEIGRMMGKVPGAAEHLFYGEWVRSYAGEEYAATNQSLIELMDYLSADVSSEEQLRLEEIFVNCSRYELRFWDMAWKMSE